MVFERMMAELPSLLNPIFGIALNNPDLGRAEVDRLFELLQRPAIAKCVRLPMSFRSEWSDASHPKHRLYELAMANCQNFTKADLHLWLALRITRRTGTKASQRRRGVPIRHQH